MKYKIITLLSLTIIVFQLFNYKQVKNSSNEDLINVKSSNWISLFKNNSLEGWHYFQDDGNKSGWTVDEGVFTFTSENASGEGDKSLLSDKDYSSFIIYFEWKVSPRSNSGFFWGVQEDLKYEFPYVTGPEIQILDLGLNDETPDKTTIAGGLYGLAAPKKIVTKEANQWNNYLITIDQEKNYGNVVHNGVDIVTFPLRGNAWKKMLEGTKFVDCVDEWKYCDFGKFKTGKISIQDHPGIISFRNMKIKELYAD
jgi:hypothetical protein